MQKTNRPLRILHVVPSLTIGGVQIWLMHVLGGIDRQKFHMDFVIHYTKTIPLKDQVRTLGAEILCCPRHTWNYSFRFKRLLQEYGPYDIIHSHNQDFSGYVLRLAEQSGIPVRIAHSHSVSASQFTPKNFLRSQMSRIWKKWIQKYASLGLAVSEEAAAALFGQQWQADPRWRVLYCGIDLKPYGDIVESGKIRAAWGIQPDEWVIGHVGRFNQVKNHAFMIEIAAAIARRDPRMRLMFIGDGPLRPDIAAKAGQAGLIDKVIFTGMRSDVPGLLKGAVDIFLFPSFFEGLGLVVIEAQAAGVPCLISDVITPEVEVIPGLVQRLSLSLTASQWAEKLLEMKEQPGLLSQPEALSLIAASPFNIEKSRKALQSIYLTAAPHSI